MRPRYRSRSAGPYTCKVRFPWTPGFYWYHPAHPRGNFGLEMGPVTARSWVEPGRPVLLARPADPGG